MSEDMSAATAQAQGPSADITIQAPSGQSEVVKFHPQQTVGHTLDHTVKEFARKGWLDGSGDYILVLSVTPLESNLTLEQAGVTPGATLKVRAKQTPGDGHASRAE